MTNRMRLNGQLEILSHINKGDVCDKDVLLVVKLVVTLEATVYHLRKAVLMESVRNSSKRLRKQ